RAQTSGSTTTGLAGLLPPRLEGAEDAAATFVGDSLDVQEPTADGGGAAVPRQPAHARAGEAGLPLLRAAGDAAAGHVRSDLEAQAAHGCWKLQSPKSRYS